MRYKKGHKQSNTGRTHFKKGEPSYRKGIKMTEEQKKKISLSKKGQTSWNKGLKGYKSGSDNCNWKGGITEENDIIRKSKDHKDWSKEVYAKDNYECFHCGKHCQKGDIVAHHLLSFANYPDIRFIVDNGITMCRSCHLKLHNRLRKQDNLLNRRTSYFAVPSLSFS